jgi:multidrug efflux pump subunit AcrB
VILRGALDTAALSGLIVAGGLAVNNTILAVDALRARAPDFSLQPAEARCRAIAGALSQRLETLVLTTSSTLAGSIPLFLFNGPSGSFAATLAAAVCSGVAGSLAAALLFLPPLFYALPRLCRASFSSPFAPSRLESESNHY